MKYPVAGFAVLAVMPTADGGAPDLGVVTPLDTAVVDLARAAISRACPGTGGDAAPAPAFSQLFLPQDATANNCAFLVDTSGSMYDLLPSVQSGLCRAVSALPARVAFNVIAYSTEVAAWKPSAQRSGTASRQAACEWIRGLQVGGSTNTMAALREAFSDATVSVVVLLSDGMPDDRPRDILAVSASACPDYVAE